MEVTIGSVFLSGSETPAGEERCVELLATGVKQALLKLGLRESSESSELDPGRAGTGDRNKAGGGGDPMLSMDEQGFGSGPGNENWEAERKRGSMLLRPASPPQRRAEASAGSPGLPWDGL